jgi:hypothetical protein
VSHPAAVLAFLTMAEPGKVFLDIFAKEYFSLSNESGIPNPEQKYKE